MAGIIVTVNNFDPVNITEQSLVGADVAATSSTITVKDIQGFTADEYVVIGRRGEEQTEIRKISSITGQTLTLDSALTNAHRKDEEIIETFGNQIKLKTSANVDGTTPADSTFTDLTTLTIQPDQMQVDYTDSTGSSDVWYKYTFYNSTTSEESVIADSIQAWRGGLVNYATIDQIRQEAGFNNTRGVTDSMIRARRLDAEGEILGALASANYSLPLTSVPFAVKNISRILSAGYLLWEQYGLLEEGTNRNGKEKIDWARSQLDMIISGKLLLVGEDGSTITPVTRNNVQFWPDNTTKDATQENAGGDFAFRRKEEY